jgi:asparagine synthase (glutamine-hydrolysing)|tara:strand:- start:2842 stop:4710 length:1869 start_codon:yes stop_codon:yes gene_type:complete
MCGIALCYSNKLDHQTTVKQIIKKIKHRGPDDEKYLNLKNFSLGSCRLSIFDLSKEGSMPMTDSQGRYTIIYNGEIYNFKELRKQFNLKTRTNTDTEVLLELYVIKKEKCLDYLNGIFAFVIYDNIENSFFCARDQLGVKPFYYIKDENKFIVSSEINGISEIFNNKLNLSTVKSYVTKSFYDYGINTFYENIKQLEPGNFIKYSLKENNFNIKKYWEIKKNDNQKKNHLVEKNLDSYLIDQAYDLIERSISLQCKADVKIGVNVSGGIDSRLMISILNRVNNGQKDISANSFYYDESSIDEKKDLEQFSKLLNWKINFYKITSNDVINNFDEILINQEGPFPGIPTIAKSLLIKRAYEPNCKVILEGQGGDDIAGGYKYIFGAYIYDLIKEKNFFNILNETSKFKKIENETWISVIKYIYNSMQGINKGGYSADGTRNVDLDVLDPAFLRDNRDNDTEIKESISNIENNLEKIIYRDINFTKLPRILKSCDRSSMSYGKELRVPFLDKNIASFFYNLDNKYKIKNGNLRYLYREMIQKKFNINAYEKKRYISDPQVKWLKEDLFEWAYSILSDQKTFYDGIYNTKKLLGLFKKFKKDSNWKNSNLFWQALCIKKMIKNNYN